MRRVTYQSVLAAASTLWDGKASPDVRTAAQLNVFLNRRAVEYWERFPWPEWSPTERRFYGLLYDNAELLDPGDVRYWPPTNAYYQVLGGVGGFPGLPGGYPPADAAGITDEANWALLPLCTPADWVDAAAYDTGDQVRHPKTLRRYQARAAVAAGAFEPGVAVNWQSAWGEVLDFYRVIPLEQEGQTAIGECFRVFPCDPRLGPTWPLHHEIIREGILVRGGPNVVWIRFRERAPRWTSSDTANPTWTATTTFPLAGQAWSSAEGDYFQSLVAGNLNRAVTDTAYWARVPFPYVLRDAVAQAAYADLLRLDGQHEKFTGAAREALRLLQREFDKLERQQGQTARLPVHIRE